MAEGLLFHSFWVYSSWRRDRNSVLVIFMQSLRIKTTNRDIDSFEAADFELINYDAHKKISMKLAV